MDTISPKVPEEDFRIDIEKAIASKSKRLLKWLPWFVIRYIKKITHQDDINDFLIRNKGEEGVDFCSAVLNEFEINVIVRNEEKIPRDNRRYLFIANHPLGGLEGLAFIRIVHKYHPEIKFPVNDLLLHLRQMKDIFIPINTLGRQTRDYVKMMDETYKSDSQILFFPAGMVSRKIKGVVTDLEWKKNFVNIARKYQRDIVPVHIDGRNSRRFYRIHSWRKFIGIKANIEIFYLIDELFNYRHNNRTVTFTIGDTIPYDSLDKSHTPQEWALKIRKIVYDLAEN